MYTSLPVVVVVVFQKLPSA